MYLENKLDSKTGIYRTDFEEGNYVLWKPLPWGKFKKHRDAKRYYGDLIDVAIQEIVFRECVLYSSFDKVPEELSPEEIPFWLEIERDTQNAGIKPTIVGLIMQASGITRGEDLEYAIEEARASISIEDRITARICHVFNAYTVEMLEELSWQDVMARLIQTELVTGDIIQLTPLEEDKAPEIEEQNKRLNRIIQKAHENGRYDPSEDQPVKEEIKRPEKAPMSYEQFVESRENLRDSYRKQGR